jgi:hypothetical protein
MLSNAERDKMRETCTPGNIFVSGTVLQLLDDLDAKDAELKEATERADKWERLHDGRTAELDAKDRDIGLLKQEYSRATGADVAALAAKDAELAKCRAVLADLKDEFKSADEERLRETDNAHVEANRWKAEDDMYGWNFHEGRASGTVSASLYFYRVFRKLKAALADAPAAQPSEAERWNEACRVWRERCGEVEAKLAKCRTVLHRIRPYFVANTEDKTQVRSEIDSALSDEPTGDQP